MTAGPPANRDHLGQVLGQSVSVGVIAALLAILVLSAFDKPTGKAVEVTGVVLSRSVKQIDGPASLLVVVKLEDGTVTTIGAPMVHKVASDQPVRVLVYRRRLTGWAYYTLAKE